MRACEASVRCTGCCPCALAILSERCRFRRVVHCAVRATTV